MLAASVCPPGCASVETRSSVAVERCNASEVLFLTVVSKAVFLLQRSKRDEHAFASVGTV